MSLEASEEASHLVHLRIQRLQETAMAQAPRASPPLAEAGEELPESYVMVEDQRGNPLYSSRDELRHEARRAEYFQIVLGEQQAEPSPG